DFGIAKVFAGDQLTATGGVIGTAHYLSPEQAAGKPVTPRSDFYSLGVVLYHLLTGRPPFDGESILDLLHKHRFAQFDSPRKLVPEVPHDVDELVCQLLQKDPARRPPDGGVLARQIERLRGKLERQAQQTIISATEEATASEGEVAAAEKAPGPATLMSRLMRQELEGYKYGGPVRRLFNQPIVLVTLFLLCVGTIVWTVWRPRPSADELFQNGARLMESENPADWEEARKSYFDPLNQEYPGHPYQKEVEEYLQRIDDHEALRRALEGVRPTKAISEGQRFYQEGLRRCQAGDDLGARRVWQNLVVSCDKIDAEQRWVRLAKRGLAELDKRLAPAERRWETIREALRRAQRLRDEGDEPAAQKIWSALEDLYRDDPAAQTLLKEFRGDRRR
ncbi:MAG TPA: protein kinase, partial [Gemmataceae bacterium]|nr:protein kinase [Gemmataceae bacterium]